MSTPQKVIFSWDLPDDFRRAQDGGGTPVHAGQLMLDASINEQHQKGADVTEHHVETGSDITDHIRPLPDKLSIEGFVSNQPLGGVPLTYNNGVQGRVRTFSKTVAGRTVAYSAFTFDEAIERVKQVYGDLGVAIAAGALFTITTTLATYEQMACTSFNAVRNAQNGQVLRFTAEFRKLTFATVETVDALPSKATKHRGAKPGKEASPQTDAQVRRSTAKAIKNWVTGALSSGK